MVEVVSLRVHESTTSIFLTLNAARMRDGEKHGPEKELPFHRRAHVTCMGGRSGSVGVSNGHIYMNGINGVMRSKERYEGGKKETSGRRKSRPQTPQFGNSTPNARAGPSLFVGTKRTRAGSPELRY
jgi:hypothetical protein